MKKKFALVLALCMLVTIAAAGCGEKAAEETLPEETPAVTSEVTEPVREKPMKDGKVETPYGTLTIPETVVEYIDVNLVVGASLLQQLTERILNVILVCEFQNRLIYNTTQPYHSLAGKFRSPLARANQPRGLYASELR